MIKAFFFFLNAAISPNIARTPNSSMGETILERAELYPASHLSSLSPFLFDMEINTPVPPPRLKRRRAVHINFFFDNVATAVH